MQTLDAFAKEHNLARTSVVIEEWSGKTGVALVQRETGTQVSPVVAHPEALEAWFAREGGRIAGFIRRGWDVPPDAFLRRVEDVFAKGRLRFQNELRDAERSLRLNRQFITSFAEDEDPQTRTIVKESEASALVDEGKIASHQAAIQGVDALSARLREDPASLLLPVGALVRVRETAPSRQIGPPDLFDRGLPRAGTEGVVVGLSDAKGGWTTLVAFGKPFIDRDGTEWMPEIGEPMKMSFDADDLELVALGTFHDGTPCRSVAFSETHRRAEDLGKADPGTREMVVLQADAAWRLWEFKGSRGPGSEWYDAQGRESLDELDFLVPIDAAPAPAP